MGWVGYIVDWAMCGVARAGQSMVPGTVLRAENERFQVLFKLVVLYLRITYFRLKVKQVRPSFEAGV